MAKKPPPDPKAIATLAHLIQARAEAHGAGVPWYAAKETARAAIEAELVVPAAPKPADPPPPKTVPNPTHTKGSTSTGKAINFMPLPIQVETKDGYQFTIMGNLSISYAANSEEFETSWGVVLAHHEPSYEAKITDAKLPAALSKALSPWSSVYHQQPVLAPTPALETVTCKKILLHNPHEPVGSWYESELLHVLKAADLELLDKGLHRVTEWTIEQSSNGIIGQIEVHLSAQATKLHLPSETAAKVAVGEPVPQGSPFFGAELSSEPTIAQHPISKKMAAKKAMWDAPTIYSMAKISKAPGALDLSPSNEHIEEYLVSGVGLAPVSAKAMEILTGMTEKKMEGKHLDALIADEIANWPDEDVVADG